jgi:anti-sigma factor RsiW
MKQRDIELLSAYLDGELKSVDLTKLESRLKADLELVSVLNDLRAARTLLRKLPSRKAPRNFTLTRKMAGQNPPLPRAYPFFRYATTIATLLFFFTFGLNFMGAQFASQAPVGMGGGGGSDVESYAAEAPALEAPAAAPAPAGPEIAADATSVSEPAVALAPMVTGTPLSEDASRSMETPAQKSADAGNSVEQAQPPVMADSTTQQEMQSPAPLVPSMWQIGLAIVAVISALLMGLMQQLSARRWK